MPKWALAYHGAVAGGQLLRWMCSTRVAASLDDAAGGHPCWLMAQRAAAALKVSRRPKDSLRFGEERWRAEGQRRPVCRPSCSCHGLE